MSESAGGSIFGTRLRVIVEQSRSPQTGKPYTAREIAEGTGMSDTYVRVLLRGEVEMPSAARVQKLAWFLSATVDDLAGAPVGSSEQASNDVDAELQRALSDPRIKAMALRASGLEDREKAVLLNMVKSLLDLFPDASHAAPQPPRDDDDTSPPA